MCELLGISFSNPVRPVFAFHGLMGGAWLNGDTWGLGLYPQFSKTAQVFKEFNAAASSDLAEFLPNYRGLWADLFVGQIRKASKDTIAFHNTQPFNRHYAGREWLFCQDGTLNNLKRILRQAYVPAGDTGSEQIFCQLLSMMKKDGISPVFQNRYHGFTDDDFCYIHQLLLDINGVNNGDFNVIFTDGVYLFSYRDKNGARELSYLQRQYPFDTTVLRGSNDDYEIDIHGSQNATDRGVIISSKTLSDEEWVPFKNGEMIVVRNGNIVAQCS